MTAPADKVGFTPAPWSRGQGERLPRAVLDPKTHYTIAICEKDALQPQFPPAEAEREANARLIAAAPELYEALEIVRTQLSGSLSAQGLLEEVDAALAKARGEQ